jgi:hypothetical protein
VMDKNFSVEDSEDESGTRILHTFKFGNDENLQGGDSLWVS